MLFYYIFAVCQHYSYVVTYKYRLQKGLLRVDIYLKEFRKKRKLSQREVAESIGIDQRQWSRYENGINEFPIRYLKQICELYSVSADEILGISAPK